MTGLSLPAELLLLSIDPAEGGFATTSRRRLRDSLALAEAAEAGTGRPPRRAGGAWRRARRELAGAGLARRSGPLGRELAMVEREMAGERRRRMLRDYRDGHFEDERNAELFVLLAWNGALGSRMSRDERRIAARRLRDLEPTEALGAVAAAASLDLFSASTAELVELGGGKSGGPSEIEAALGSMH